MGKRKRNSNPEIGFFCEWDGCPSQQHTEPESFWSHLRTHCDQVIEDNGGSDGLDGGDDGNGLTCRWFGCNEVTFANSGELRVHISYHGFHSKLMSLGFLEIKSISDSLGKQVGCGIDGSTRTLLPPLPDMFVCGWKDCFAIFHEAEEFYRHVEKHPFDRKQNKPEAAKDRHEAQAEATESEAVEADTSGEEKADPEPVKCLWLDCSFSSDSNSHIRQHLRSHTQEKIIACPNCGAMFSHKNKFRDHLLRQLDDNEETNQAITLEINEEQEIMVTIHSDASSQPALTYKCEHCDKSFHSSSLLREHNRRHYHYYRCDVCGQTTDSPSALKHHKTYRHSDNRPFACQFCEAKFKTRSDLRKHLEIHNEDNPFKCNLCDFECRCCHTLAKHMKRLHQSTMNEYLCHECDKKFTRGNNLTRHLVTIHGYSLKPGQSRFIYERDDDGIFKLCQS